MIDEIGLKILNILQEKARIPNVEVARQVGMAPSAVLERIRKLEKQGVIDGYEVRLNPTFFQRRLIAFLFVQIAPENGAAASGSASDVDPGDVFAQLPEVQEAHYVAGADCYLLKVRVADPGALDTVLRDKILPVRGVRSVKTHVVLSTRKETLRMPLEVPPYPSVPNNGE